LTHLVDQASRTLVDIDGPGRIVVVVRPVGIGTERDVFFELLQDVVEMGLRVILDAVDHLQFLDLRGDVFKFGTTFLEDSFDVVDMFVSSAGNVPDFKDLVPVV